LPSSPKAEPEARRGELERALHGRFTEHHARPARLLLDQIDELTTHVDQVTALLNQRIGALAEFAVPAATGTTIDAGPNGINAAVERLRKIPGAGPDDTRAVMGEMGLDMSVFGTHQRLCSWAKTSPLTKQSGRKNRKASTGKGNPYLKAALAQMATGAAKTDTFLGERHRRLTKRMPKPKALAAIGGSILLIIFHMLAAPPSTSRTSAPTITTAASTRTSAPTN
jgi:transposase